MKKFRLLIYEGSPEWIARTLDCSLTPTPIGSRHIFGPGSIRIIEDLSEVTDITERMNTQREVDSSIPPEEAI